MWIGPPKVLGWPNPMSSNKHDQHVGSPAGGPHLETRRRSGISHVEHDAMRVLGLGYRQHRAVGRHNNRGRRELLRGGRRGGYPRGNRHQCQADDAGQNTSFHNSLP